MSWFDQQIPPGQLARELLDSDALRAWANGQPSLQTATAQATRGDWLLFLALLSVEDEPQLRTLVEATCAVVAEIVPLGPADLRPRAALVAAQRWARGEVERTEPRSASAMAQAAAVGLTPSAQVVCHACAACARAVLALERAVGWKAIIADQTVRATAQLLAEQDHPPPADGDVAAYDARRQALASARAAHLARFADQLRAALT